MNHHYFDPHGPRDYIEAAHGAPEPKEYDMPDIIRETVQLLNGETSPTPSPLSGNPYPARMRGTTVSLDADVLSDAVLALAYETRRQTRVLEKRARLAALTAAERGIRLPDDLYELIEEER